LACGSGLYGDFLLWLIVMRPHEFPATLAEWLSPAGLIGALARVAVQLVLVALCFGIGRGIGGILGYLPAFPLAFPLGISILSIPLSRLLWNPRKEREMDQFLDEALGKVAAESKRLDLFQDPDRDAAFLEALNGLPASASEEEIWAFLIGNPQDMDADRIADVLLREADAESASPLALRALMLMGSDGATIERVAETSLPLLALRAVQADGALVARFARRLAAALAEDSDLWGVCPNERFLENLIARHPDAAADLQALMALNRSLDPDNRPAD
jgi:hypothetical protein